MKTIKLVVLIFVLLFTLPKISGSQDKEIIDFFKNFKLSSYADAYYAYDNDKNIFQEQRLLNCVSPYKDQFRLNIASVSLKYDAEKIRSTFTLHYGDIPDVNWAPYTRFNTIQEANIGFSPFKNLWIDAGYFITHVGAEGFPNKNFLSSYSLPSYVEPFLQSGIKVGYDFNDKFSACLHLINGYNLFEDNNKNKSFGVQLSYSPIEQFNISYNNIIGNEMTPDVDGKTRVFNNLILNLSPCKRIDITASFDLAIQEKSKRLDANASAYTYGAFISTKY